MKEKKKKVENEELEKLSEKKKKIKNEMGTIKDMERTRRKSK